jgi:hypothetical protein
MTTGVDREWGEELCTIIIIRELDPRLEHLRCLDEWLISLTAWQQHLVAMAFALLSAGVTVWLNSVLPPVDPNLLFLGSPFGLLP